jgi:hypothetical protein
LVVVAVSVAARHRLPARRDDEDPEQERRLAAPLDPKPQPRALLLTAERTKTYETRRVPVSTNVRAVLAMRRHRPNGKEFGPDAFVFGNEVGEQVGSIKTAWRAACRHAGIRNLHFHDLRREFASRLMESGVEQHIVRDFLGHANITTTSRYLKSSTFGLERSLQRLEEHQKSCHEPATANSGAAIDSSTEEPREPSNAIS